MEAITTWRLATLTVVSGDELDVGAGTGMRRLECPGMADGRERLLRWRVGSEAAERRSRAAASSARSAAGGGTRGARCGPRGRQRERVDGGAS